MAITAPQLETQHQLSKECKKLIEEYNELYKHISDSKKQLEAIKEKIIAFDFGLKNEGAQSYRYKNMRLTFTGRPRRTLDSARILQDWNTMPADLRQMFRLKPELKNEQYHAMKEINGMQVAQYVTEKGSTISLKITEIKPKDEGAN